METLKQVTIASIYPMEKHHIFPRRNRGAEYALPAVQRGEKPALCVVETTASMDYIGEGRTIPTEIPAIQDARALVTMWGNPPGTREDAGPGIWVVEIPDGEGWVGKPTVEQVMGTEEYQRQIARQDRFFSNVLHEGDERASEKSPGLPVQRIHRLACEYLNEAREWNIDYGQGSKKDCQWCGRAIPKSAVICEFCSQVVDFARHAQLVSEREAAMRMAHAAHAADAPGMAEQADTVREEDESAMESESRQRESRQERLERLQTAMRLRYRGEAGAMPHADA